MQFPEGVGRGFCCSTIPIAASTCGLIFTIIIHLHRVYSVTINIINIIAGRLQKIRRRGQCKNCIKKKIHFQNSFSSTRPRLHYGGQLTHTPPVYHPPKTTTIACIHDCMSGGRLYIPSELPSFLLGYRVYATYRGQTCALPVQTFLTVAREDEETNDSVDCSVTGFSLRILSTFCCISPQLNMGGILNGSKSVL